MKKEKEIKWVLDSEVTEMFPPQSYKKTIKDSEFDLLMKNYTKKQLALIVMEKDEEIWDLMNELDTKTYDLISYKIPPYYEEIEE